MRAYSAVATCAGLALILAAFLLAGCSREADLPEARILPVEAATVEPTEGYTRRHVFLGRVESRQSSALGFELSGRITRILVDLGDEVTGDAPLAFLDTERLDARRTEIDAALREARAAQALAKSTLDRNRQAFESNSVSAQQLDEALQAYAQRVAATDRLAAQLEFVDVDLRKSVLRAPWPAVIARRHVDEGEVIQPGQAVLRLQESNAPRVRVGVTREAADTLQPGQAVHLTVGQQHRPGRIERIAPVLTADARTVDVLIAVDNHRRPVPDGTVAEFVWDERVEKPGFWLPRSALTEGERGLWACFVAAPLEEDSAGATHRLERRPLEWVHQEGERVFVRGPLQAGETVVASGMHRVGVGQRVTLTDARTTVAQKETDPTP